MCSAAATSRLLLWRWQQQPFRQLRRQPLRIRRQLAHAALQRRPRRGNRGAHALRRQGRRQFRQRFSARRLAAPPALHLPLHQLHVGAHVGLEEVRGGALSSMKKRSLKARAPHLLSVARRWLVDGVYSTPRCKCASRQSIMRIWRWGARSVSPGEDEE